jgi:hypothetical protein
MAWRRERVGEGRRGPYETSEAVVGVVLDQLVDDRLFVELVPLGEVDLDEPVPGVVLVVVDVVELEVARLVVDRVDRWQYPVIRNPTTLKPHIIGGRTSLVPARCSILQMIPVAR